MRGIHREPDDLNRGIPLADHTGRLQPVHSRHVDVHEHDIRRQRPGQIYGLTAVSRLTDQLNVRRLLQDVPQFIPHEPMVIREVSVTGTTVETRFPLHLNSLHDFRLTLGDRSVVVKGRVVHSQISDVDSDIVTYRSGVEFVEPSERVTKAISEFLDMVKSSRSGV